MLRKGRSGVGKTYGVPNAAAVAGRSGVYTRVAGVACARGELGAEELFKQADRALYRAKNSGRDRVVRWTEACD